MLKLFTSSTAPMYYAVTAAYEGLLAFVARGLLEDSSRERIDTKLNECDVKTFKDGVDAYPQFVFENRGRKFHLVCLTDSEYESVKEVLSND